MAAEGAPALTGPVEAKLRQLACDFYAAGCGGKYQPCLDERAMAAAQWALAGRAWSLIDAYEEAVKCFDAAMQPWASASVPGSQDAEQEAAQLAEAACQAQLWLSAHHFRRDAHEEAFQALSTARDALSALRNGEEDIMLDDLLKSCYEQALAHRGAGNSRLAVELLMLAVAALPSTAAVPGVAAPTLARDAPLKARLMRQLALCYAELQDRGAALAYAREAVATAPFLSGQHRALSLQVLLRILCGYSCTDAPCAGAEEEEVQRMAMSLMSQPEAGAEDCLAICSLLLEREGREAAVDSCLGALGARIKGDVGACCQLLLFKLRLAAKSAEATLHSEEKDAAAALARLDEVVAEAKALGGEGSELPGQVFRAVASALCDLRCAASDAGRDDLAVRWLQQAVPFAASPAEAANFWVTAAVCLRRAGRTEEVCDFAGKALALDPSHLQAGLLQLVSLAEQGEDSQASPSELRGLLERLHAHPALDLSHAALAAKALLQHPDEGLALAGLEALARRMARGGDEAGEAQESAARVGLDGLKVARELLARSAAPARPEGELLRHLALATELLAARRAVVALELQEGGGPGADDLRGIVNATWSRGQALGQADQWDACAGVFEALQRLLEQLDSVDSREVLEPRAWCLAMIASSRLQCVKELPGRPRERGELCEQALQCLERAHQLCRRAERPPQGEGREAAAVDSSLRGALQGSTLGRLFMVLVLLEFEARCLAGDSEAQLRHFVDGASQQEAVGIKSLLAMSKIAGASSSRRLAIHCLQRYLRVFIGARGAVDFSQCAAAYREMIVLHASRNESFAVYEGILHLLSGDGSGGGVAAAAAVGEAGGGCCAPPSYPQEEIAWLVATAWNNGAHFYRLQQYRWGERWMGKSLALARFCPPGAFPQEEMLLSYKECLKFCGD